MLNIKTFAIKYALPLWRWYLIGTIFLALTNLITLEIPQLAKEIINALDAESIEKNHLVSLSIGIIFLGAMQILARSLSRILIFFPGRKLEAESKTDLFSHTMKLPYSFLENFGMGDLISRLSNDLGQVRVFFSFAALQILNLIFLSIFTIYQMLSVHVTLTILCLFPISLMLVSSRFLMPMLNKFSRKNQESIGHLTTQVTEAFNHVHVIQTNSAEKSFSEKIQVNNEDVFQTNMKLVVFRTLYFPLLTSMTSVAQICVIGFGGYQVFQNNITVGDILAFNIYLGYLAFPLTSLGIVLSIFQRSKTAIQRIAPLADEPTQSFKETENDIMAASLLRIKDLSFSYDNEKPVLDHISLRVERGEKVGICGPVGSGKSTLFSIITRILDANPQSVFINGQDIYNIEPDQLRNTIGYALQNPELFSASIEDNLTFGLENKLSKGQLTKATEIAQVTEDIENLPENWNTQIGEKGVRLSGGQKQRLALARLFLRKHELMLFDDVLSAVDNETEKNIIQAIEKQDAAY